MSDRMTIRVVKTAQLNEHPQDELWTISLVLDSALSEELYLDIVKKELSAARVHPWRVRDERVTSTGVSEEVRDVAIFVAAAGAASFTSDLVTRIVTGLEGMTNRHGPADDIGDARALELAILTHRELDDAASLSRMERRDSGNRVFTFDDGTEVELDPTGITVRIQT
jgi:hypothetical protein